MKNPKLLSSLRGLAALSTAFLVSYAVLASPAGLVAYWPLDDVNGLDAAGGHHLVPLNLDSSHLIAGRHGNAIRFTGQEMLAAIHEPEDTLPIFKHQPYSITAWVRADGGAANQFFFGMASTTATQPLFMLGKDNTGATGAFNPFLRNDANSTRITHGRMTAATLFDGNWRHVAWIDDGGSVRVYIDGVLDGADLNYTLNGTFTPKTTAIGAVSRGGNPVVPFQGDVDDVAVWQVGLTPAQVSAMAAGTLPNEVAPDAPFITRQPQGANVLKDDSVQFDVRVIGTPAFSYQWRRGDQDISGATNATIVIESAQASDAGEYRVVVTNDHGATTSETALLEVQMPDPEFPENLVSYWPLDQVIAGYTPDIVGGHDMTAYDVTGDNIIDGRIGRAVKFTGANHVSNFESAPIYSYGTYSISAWVRSDGGAPNQFFFTMASSNANQPLFMMGKDNTGATDSLNTYIRTDANSVVLTHGRMSQETVFDGIWHHVTWVDSNGAVRVYIDGQLDGADLNYTPGTLTLNSTTIGGLSRVPGVGSVLFRGDVDDVAVWRAALTPEDAAALAAGIRPSDLHRVAEIESSPPSILFHPEGGAVVAGSSFTFSVAPYGLNLSYQWHKGGVTIDGATNRTLTLTDLATGDSGSYHVVVSNLNGGVASNPAVLDVQDAIAIVTQPVGLVRREGAAALFRVTAAGQEPLSYQWFKGGQPVTGATANQFLISVVIPDDAGDYTVQVSNEADSILSDAASLEVLPPAADPDAPVLSIDFNIRGADPNLLTEPGFSPFVIDGTGLQLAPVRRSFEGVDITLSDTSGVGYDDRQRGTPANSGDFTQSLLLRDFVINWSGQGTEGFDVLIEGLIAGQHYTVSIWSFDTSSGGDRVSDWYANGELVYPEYWFDGTIHPTSNDDYRFEFLAQADAFGHILVQGRRNELTAGTFGVYLNALQLTPSAAPPAVLLITAIEVGPSAGQLRLLIESAFPGREHWVERKGDLVGAEWEPIAAEFAELPGGLLEAVLTLPPGATHFFRVVSVVPEAIFSDDFESGAPGWTHGGINSAWELGTPTTGPGGAHSGGNVWANGLHGSYSLNAQAWLRSPVIDLTDVSQATLSFWEYRDVEPATGEFMFHWVQVSVKDAADPDGEPLAVLMKAAGAQRRWTEHNFPLEGAALGKPVILEFLLVSDDWPPVLSPDTGWFIDDVSVMPE